MCIRDRSRGKSINDQIEEQLKLIERKFPTGKVIAYFQNVTNTYGDVEYLSLIHIEMCIRDRYERIGMDEPLMYQLSRQWHSWVLTFGTDNR